MDDINVRDYGALGDGKDYTSQIQAALNMGGRIYIPKGTYLISNPLVIKKNTHIIMDYNAILKRGASVIINNNAGTAMERTSGPYAIFTNGNKTDSFSGYNGNGNIVIEGGIIDCNKEKIGTKDGSNMGISFAHGENIIIKNVIIKDVRSGHHIEINSSRHVLIENCRFLNHTECYLTGGLCNSEAIQLDFALGLAYFPLFETGDKTKCTNITIRDCYFADCGCGIGSHSDTGNENLYHEGIKILNNFFYSTKYNAIKPYYWKKAMIKNNVVLTTKNHNGLYSKKLVNSVISDNVFEGIKSSGIYLQNNEQVTISGGIIDNADEHGIDIQQSNHIKINNMDIFSSGERGVNIVSNYVTVHNCSIRNSTGEGICISSGQNCIVSDCRIRGGSTYGIASITDSKNNSFQNNILIFNNNTDILVALNASNNKVIGNKIVNSKTVGSNIWVQSGTSKTVIARNDLAGSNLTRKLRIDSTTGIQRNNIV